MLQTEAPPLILVCVRDAAVKGVDGACVESVQGVEGACVESVEGADGACVESVEGADGACVESVEVVTKLSKHLLV